MDSESPGLAEWLAEWVLTYVHEPNLRPVAVAILGHVVLVIAGVALLGWRTESAVAWAALVALALGSAGLGAVEIREIGRPGPAWLALALTWIAGIALAWFAERTGVF